jgi:hypothetical protein
MASTIQDVNIRLVLAYLEPGKSYFWNPASGTDIDADHGHTMDAVTWNDVGEKPSEAAVIAEWDSRSDRYEIVNLSYAPNGDYYDVSAELVYNIDGVTELTFVLNDIEMPAATPLVGNVATITFNPTVDTIIRIAEDYPHTPLVLEI